MMQLYRRANNSNGFKLMKIMGIAYIVHLHRDNFLGSGGNIAEEFGVLAKALWSGHYRHITPRDFKVYRSEIFYRVIRNLFPLIQWFLFHKVEFARIPL